MGLKEEFCLPLQSPANERQGLTELCSIESYRDPGSEDLLSSTQLALGINTQSEDRAREGIMCKRFMWPVLQVACEISTHIPLTRTHGHALLQKRLGNIKQLVPNRRRKQISQTIVTLCHRHYYHTSCSQEANSTF